MRILVVATTFPRWVGDTEPAFVFDLCAYMAQFGHQITVLAPHAAGASHQEKFSGHTLSSKKSGSCPDIEVVRFPYWPSEKGQRLCYNGGALPNLRSSWMARFNLPFFLLQQNRWIGRLLRQESFDLVHVHWLLPQGFFAVRHARKLRIPVILTAHAGDIFPLRKPGLRSMIHATALRGQALTVNSQATREALQDIIPECDPLIIPMGVDLDLFSGQEDAGQVIRQKLAPDGPLILNTGRLASKKGQMYLIQAMPAVLKVHPTARLAIIGSGPLESQLKKEIEALGLKDSVTLLGHIPHQEMPAYYAAADLFAMPSIVTSSGDTEGLGVALLEAMAAVVPCIASSVGGILDVIENGQSGVLVPEKYPEKLSAGLIDLLNRPEFAKQLAQNGRRRVENRFAWPAVAERFQKLYESVLS